MINIEPYFKTRSRSPSPTPEPTTTAPSTEQATVISTASSLLTPELTKPNETDDINYVTDSLATLTVTSRTSTTNTTTSSTTTTVSDEEPKEELSPEEAKLRAQGLKSTHRPGFYIHINSPKRLRVQTASKTFDLDRYCPHANADMLKWGVLRDNNTLRCGVHYWGFDLAKNGQCIAHPDETLNACPVDSGLECYFCTDHLRNRWNLCLFDAGHRGYSCVDYYDFPVLQDFSTSESPSSGHPVHLYLCDVIEKRTVRGWSPED
ncbi:hypothetical protein BGZ96_006441 [Linnemannia gamsii]|uniref:Rieske domain-containing protein n=1 Tax=Linnemannia gamsii TaxID=64522 RepID=A0ABQ7K4N1_9FUNG|nr:hypothetical protein BGZ96_006441 [Linnemannia gamsii]